MTTFPWHVHALAACSMLYMAIKYPLQPQAPMFLEAARIGIKNARRQL